MAASLTLLCGLVAADSEDSPAQLRRFIGQQVGDRWEQWKDSLHYIDYAVAACIVLGVAYLVVRRWRRGSGEPADELDAGAGAENDRRAAADAVR